MAKQEEIKIIAYHLWEGDSRRHGRDLEHWLKAEAICKENGKVTSGEVPQKVKRKQTKKTA